MVLHVVRMVAVLVFFSLLLLVQSKNVPLPRYTVNLDSPPEERWSKVASDYREELFALIKYFKSLSPSSFEMLSIMGAALDQYFPEPYASEMKSFVKYTNLTVGEIVFWNMLYEVSAFSHGSMHHRACTGIIVRMASGQIIHGRNLDYGIGPLRNIAIIVDFQHSGKTVYTGTTFAGYIGFTTGQKPNGFTISLNERDSGDWSLNAIQAEKIGTRGMIALMIRDVVANPDLDFEKAVQTLSSAQIIAPCYLIIGGLSGDEGAVITQNRTMGIDVWRLNAEQGRWFLVETNYDHWKPAPSRDDRRDAAINALKTTGQASLNNETMFEILSTPPVLNDATIFTTVMSASDPNLVYKGCIRLPDN